MAPAQDRVKSRKKARLKRQGSLSLPGLESADRGPADAGLTEGAFSGAALSPPCPERAYIGIDEAGRGCLAGPVVAGATLFAPGFSFAAHLPGLDDSKKLAEAKRLALAPLVRQHALAWGIGIAWQDEVDGANILNATFRAMGRAVLALYARLAACNGAKAHGPATAGEPGAASGPPSLPGPEPLFVSPSGPAPLSGLESLFISPADSLPDPLPALLPLFIDGNRIIPEQQWRLCATGAAGLSYGRAPQCPPCAEGAMQSLARQGLFSSPDSFQESSPALAEAFQKAFPGLAALPEQQAVIRGDSRCPSIAAASILAKTVRDAIMLALAPCFPEYAFDEHKGYGTAVHLAALEAHGPCALHRLSFRKVRPEERQLSLL